MPPSTWRRTPRTPRDPGTPGRRATWGGRSCPRRHPARRTPTGGGWSRTGEARSRPARRSPLTCRLVEHGARPVPRDGLVARLLPAVPQPRVEHPRRYAQPLPDQLACVYRARPYLLLLLPRRQQLLAIDARGQLCVVAQHAVDAKHVRHEIVGEDREPVEVVELGEPGQGEVVRNDLGALPEAAVVEHRHARGERLG